MRKTRIRNPDDTPDIDARDPLRRLAGGETPAEMTARLEREHRHPALRILDRLARKTRPD